MSFLSSSRSRLVPHFRLFSTTLSISPSISLSSAKSKLRFEQDPEKSLAIFSSISYTSSTPISFRYALDLTVKRLAESRRFADIETLIESQKTQNPNITQEPFFSSLIISYGRAGMLDHAIRTFDQMNDMGIPRSAISFNALLSAGIHSQKFDRVPELFSEIPQKYGVSPDKMSYGILIKSLCESGSPEGVIPILKEMEDANIEITTIAYTTIVDAFYRKGKIEEAEKIWNEMCGKGCSLDAAAYNVKIRHIHRGKPEEVLELFKEMASSGLKPDTISYNYLLKSYCVNNRIEDAKITYQDLRRNGCVPNAATFKMMVHYLCENDDFSTALRVCKASIKRNKIPNFSTVKSLLEGLAKNSKLDAAKWLISELKKRSPNVWNEVEMELGLKDVEKESAQEAVAS